MLPRKTRLETMLERLRLKLLSGELEEDPRHARGMPRSGATRVISGHRMGVRPGGLEALPAPLLPPPEALQAVTPDLVWDLSRPVGLILEQGRLESRLEALIVVSLQDCIYSARALDALQAGAAHWRSRATLVWLQPGGRLDKAYLRRLRLGSIVLEPTSLPLVLRLVATEGGWLQRGLALDPLGPSRDHRRLLRLLAGEVVLAPGAEQDVLRISGEVPPTQLEAANGFQLEHPIRFELVRRSG